jgi:hypothetical protein
MDNNSADSVGDLVPFDKWLKSIGRARVTGWNWRKTGAVKAINVFGRVYITRAEIARFEARANSGEFASEKPQIARKKVTGEKPARRFSLRALLKA